MASRNLLARLPLWLSHWLGYRPSSPSPPPTLGIYISAFIGSFVGLSILQAIFEHSSVFRAHHVPWIIASYGASAVLCYGNIESPLAQPRPLVGGHFFSALTGLCITKLFRLLPSIARFESLRWLAGSLSTATAISIMSLTKTTHPPAGATALLVATNDATYALGWYLLPVVLLSSTIVLMSALLVNNMQRRYPTFWWEPDTAAQNKSLEGSPEVEKPMDPPPSSQASVSRV